MNWQFQKPRTWSGRWISWPIGWWARACMLPTSPQAAEGQVGRTDGLGEAVRPRRGQSRQISDRSRKRRSRPLSRLNMPPRPGTTSMTRRVCFQASYWLAEM